MASEDTEDTACSCIFISDKLSAIFTCGAERNAGLVFTLKRLADILNLLNQTSFKRPPFIYRYLILDTFLKYLPQPCSDVILVERRSKYANLTDETSSFV